MNSGFALFLALGIGVVAGLRSMTAPAIVAWAGHLGWISLSGSHLAFMGLGLGYLLGSPTVKPHTISGPVFPLEDDHDGMTERWVAAARVCRQHSPVISSGEENRAMIGILRAGADDPSVSPGPRWHHC